MTMDERDDTPKREAPFSYRAPTGKRGEVVAILQARRTTFNALVNAALFGEDAPKLRRIPQAEAPVAAELLSVLQRTNDLCKAMEAKAAGGPSEALLEACHEELVEIRGLILALHGRRP